MDDAGLERRRVLVLTLAAIDAHSVALAGFGLGSLIEIGASRGDVQPALLQ